MSNPADKANVEANEFAARQSRKDAAKLMEAARENSNLFVEQATAMLAKGVSALGATGNLGFQKNALPATGIDLGAAEATDVSGLRSSVESLQKQLEVERAKLETSSRTDYDSENNVPSSYDQQLSVVQNLEAQLKEQSERLTTLDVSGLAEVQQRDAIAYASGSDLAVMAGVRDKLERDRRKLVREAQSSALSMLEAGEHYDDQADYARDAATWNAWTTILGGFQSGVGILSGLGMI